MPVNSVFLKAPFLKEALNFKKHTKGVGVRGGRFTVLEGEEPSMID